MPTYKNTTAFLSGGRVYSNANVLSANQTEPVQYFPNNNGVLSSIQDEAQELLNCIECNGIGDSLPSCYTFYESLSIDYIP